MSQVVVVGAGVYGVTAALELRQRGHHVQLLDPGPLPHPLAASTDISKAIRLDYGPDEDYTAWMEIALRHWREWNTEWVEPLFHEVGVLFLCRAPMSPGGLEYESFRVLSERGHHPERLTADDIRHLYPAWKSAGYVDGYFNPQGGYAQSGRVISWLIERACAAGVELHEGQAFECFIESGSRVTGIVTRDGTRFDAERVIIAAGAWTPHILRNSIPEAKAMFRSNGMPVFHLKPAEATFFKAEWFPVFSADVSTTGYYGFPLHPLNGVVKIANHGLGRSLHPEAPERVVTEHEIAALRAFLADTCPALADAPVVHTRVCLYCDTWDGHFWIAPDPEHAGVIVATGGSGHGFKFAPVLGSLIADATEGRPNPLLPKFRWRPEVHPPRSEDAARYQTE